jgi:hypothetical protein
MIATLGINAADGAPVGTPRDPSIRPASSLNRGYVTT